MTQVFEVKKIDGKGLGWVANKDIKRGSVIFSENPQLELSLEQKDAKSMEINFNPNWVEKVMSSFNRMNKTDQDEYMKLSNSFDNIQFLIPQHRMILQKEIENRKTVISSKEPDKNKVEEILKILDICETNSYPQGVYIKISRLNHSCRPNAMFCEGSKSFESRIRAASKINAGEEITISYVPTTVKHMNRKERQKWLLKWRQFVCRCNFCQHNAEDEKDFALYELFHRAEQLKKDHFDSDSVPLPVPFYRQGVDLYKGLYKLGREKNISPSVLFHYLQDGFNFGYQGFLISNGNVKEQFKTDSEKFAETAEKFHKILANDAVDLELWKKRQNLETYRSNAIRVWVEYALAHPGVSVNPIPTRVQIMPTRI